jgi:hypothetical protein
MAALRLRAESAIAERFPDVTLHERTDGKYVWMSDSIREHATDVELVPPPAAGRFPTILAYPYVLVEGMRVYAPPIEHLVWLRDLKDKHPEAYRAVVAAARE